MVQTVYGIVSDYGDGSAGVAFYTDKEIVDKLLDEDAINLEQYYANEGEPACVLTFPDDFDLKAAGFRIQTK